MLALIVCQLLKMKMRSVYRQAEASAYVTADGLQLTRREDVFTHTTTARRKLERKSDSSSSSNSSSFSGGGGHGRSGCTTTWLCGQNDAHFNGRRRVA